MSPAEELLGAVRDLLAAIDDRTSQVPALARDRRVLGARALLAKLERTREILGRAIAAGDAQPY